MEIYVINANLVSGKNRSNQQASGPSGQAGTNLGRVATAIVPHPCIVPMSVALLCSI
jgi:hypothetical protein